MKEMYVVDYDLPSDKGRRQFYRHLNRILKSCHWIRSSQSVITVDDFSAALDVLQLARAYDKNERTQYRDLGTLSLRTLRKLHFLFCDGCNGKRARSEGDKLVRESTPGWQSRG